MFDIIIIYTDTTSARQTCANERAMWDVVNAALAQDAAVIFVYDENRLVWQWGDVFEE